MPPRSRRWRRATWPCRSWPLQPSSTASSTCGPHRACSPSENSARRRIIPAIMALSVAATDGRRVVSALQAELGKVILGKPGVIDDLLVALLGGGHILMEDVPGVGKT